MDGKGKRGLANGGSRGAAAAIAETDGPAAALYEEDDPGPFAGEAWELDQYLGETE